MRALAAIAMSVLLIPAAAPGALEANAPAAPAVAPAVEAGTAFALDLYKRLAADEKGKNMFFSPYSISVALTMAAEGARNETALEMGKVLGFPARLRRRNRTRPWDTAEMHEALAALTDRLTGEDTEAAGAARKKIDRLRDELADVKYKLKAMRQPDLRKRQELARKANALAGRLNDALQQVDRYELRVANALWGEKTYPFQDGYIKALDRFYDTGGLFPADFKRNFPAERRRINGWVSKQTNGRIEDLIPKLPPEQARLLRLVLTNAIYFKGQWLEPFEPGNTKDRSFTLSAGRAVETPIMEARKLESARYAAFEGDGTPFDTPARIRPGQKKGLYPGEGGFTLAELPYKGGELTMVLLAPTDPDGLAGIERRLTPEALTGWLARLDKRELNVLLPTFRLETKYALAETLIAMGMTRAFTNPLQPGGADFSGIAASDDPRDRLFISKVLHKAFVEVNEEGTEAAAATAVMMFGATAAPVTVPFTPTFRADRPFLLLIRDRTTNAILFLGRVTDPR